MKMLLALILSLGLTGCVDIPMPEYFGGEDESTTKEHIQENKSEAELAKKEYQDLQDTRTSE